MAKLFEGARKMPAWLSFRSSDNFIIIVVCMAVFTDVYVYGLLVTALPYDLDDEFKTKDEVSRWNSILLSIYGGSNAIVSPFFGLLADLGKTRQFTFQVALVFLAVSLSLYWMSSELPVLIIARVLQGLSAAAVWTVGVAVVADSFSKEHVGEAMGYTSMAMTLGTLFGPLIGGILFEKIGYHAIFINAFVLTIIDIILRCFMIEKRSAMEWLGQSDDHSKTSRPVDATPSTEPDLQVVQDETQPLLGKQVDSAPSSSSAWSLLTESQFIVALVAILVTSSMFSAFDALLPIHVKDVLHRGSLACGLVFLPFSLPSIFSPVVGRLLAKYKIKYFLVPSYLALLPAMACMRFASAADTKSQVLFCILLVVIGTLLTIQMVALMTQVSYVLEGGGAESQGSGKQHIGLAYGIFNMFYAGGIWAGAICGGTLLGSVGWNMTLLILGLANAATGFLVVFGA